MCSSLNLLIGLNTLSELRRLYRRLIFLLSYAFEKSEEIIKTFIEVFSLITLTVRII